MFKAFEATIVFDPANPDANVADVSIDVASVDTAQADRDAQVGVEWLTFPVTRTHASDNGIQDRWRRLEVDAVLTIRA